ncbi:hypothetical protein JZK55_17010 [Dissulfurispira thermophila]|uniref:Uncharacterized protein n=2 Tax=root TaxID=1 RepID=A0A7G1H3M0_9BACT|nr:hypothetical protein [Dissulfurispira thermophila]BCB96779.1 hypothetical protein JZK55_17010 [Dissulfurispira thermophila]
MLKLGFRYDEVMTMTEAEIGGYLNTYEEIINPEKTKTYVVKKGKGRGKTR